MKALAIFLNNFRQLWLVRSSTIFVGLGLLRGVGQFGFIMVMTRVMLPAEYGMYSNFLYLTSVLSPLFFLKSDVPVALHYSSNPRATPSYIGTVIILCSGITFVSGVILWLAQAIVFRVTGIPSPWQMLILVPCWTFGLFLVVSAVLQIEQRAWAGSLSRVLPAMSCELGTMAMVLVVGGGWHTALLAYTFISALWGGGFFIWLRINGYLHFSFTWQAARNFLNISLPLIPMSIGFMSVQISAQFILTRYHGPGEVGIYAAANQFSLGVWLVALACQQAFLPWLFSTLKRNEPASDLKVVVALIGLIGVLAVSTICYILVFSFIFPLVIGPVFESGRNLLPYLAWANFFMGVQMILTCFLYFREQTKTSALAVCSAAACGLAIGLWKIPGGGAVAAAYVTCCSAALAALFTAVTVLFNFSPTFKRATRFAIGQMRRSNWRFI